MTIKGIDGLLQFDINGHNDTRIEVNIFNTDDGVVL